MARQMRKCIACEKVDQSPKKIVAIADGTNGGVDVFWHYDCHAAVTGCSDCQAIVDASGGLKDDELVDFIMNQPVAVDEKELS